MKKFLQLGLLVMLAVGIVQVEGLVAAAFAQDVITIDFVDLPGADDEMEVSDQYLALNYFVTFTIDENGDVNDNPEGDQAQKPKLEDRGGLLVEGGDDIEPGEEKGFRNDVWFDIYRDLKGKGDPDYVRYKDYMDIEADEYNPDRGGSGGLGEFFLKLPTDEPENVNLLIKFARPMIEASGRIWDIDATYKTDTTIIEREQWRIIAYTKDSSDQYVEVGSILTPAGLHPFAESEDNQTDDLIYGDAKPYTWNFKSSDFPGGRGIDAVMIRFAGERSTEVGLAFDLLVVVPDPSVPPENPPVNPPAVPEPGTFLLLGLGILGLRFVLKKNRKR